MSDFDPHVPYLVPQISVKQLRAAEKLASEDLKKHVLPLQKLKGS
jgi:hypothetical protein